MVNPESTAAAKWHGATTTEKASAQEHFIDLCRMLGEPTPHEADPIGAQYAFEKRVSKAAGGDDFTFGVLHSRAHELWALGLSTRLETRPRYTPTTCFETFPFPEPTEEQRARVGEAARGLVELRDGWLNPPGLDPPDLAKRTLTNLYNQRPTWLANAHADLDAAVFAAYGWPPGLSDATILERLLGLNLARVAGK